MTSSRRRGRRLRASVSAARRSRQRRAAAESTFEAPKATYTSSVCRNRESCGLGRFLSSHPRLLRHIFHGALLISLILVDLVHVWHRFPALRPRNGRLSSRRWHAVTAYHGRCLLLPLLLVTPWPPALITPPAVCRRRLALAVCPNAKHFALPHAARRRLREVSQRAQVEREN
jgi:hypothetical protein